MSHSARLICSSHTISGVMPGSAQPARHGFDERVAACAAAGYAGMCLHLRDYRAQQEAGRCDVDLREKLESHQLFENSVEFLVDWFLEGAAGQQARRDEATAFAAAQAVGARVLNVGPDLRGRALPRAAIRRRFAELCERAGERGLSIALELVAWSDVATLAPALEIVDDPINGGLAVDCWHVFRRGVPLAELARTPAEKILCIQINDARATPVGDLASDTLCRLPCGEGDFDIAGFLRALWRAGATAPISVEIISADFAALDVAEAARVSFETARRYMTSAMAPPGAP